MIKKYTTLLVSAMLLTSMAFFSSCDPDAMKIMAVTGATPLAMKQVVPEKNSLTVDGMVKKTYTFSGSALRALASTRIRVHEFTSKKEYKGSYFYTGISLYHLLEGIAPKKPEGTYDRPLDMVVTFTSRDGKKSRFSYGELTCTDDNDPVILAFHRKEILPSKNADKYKKNAYHDDVTGLRLVAPGDADDSRYLDDVTRITMTVPAAPEDTLPPQKKGEKCSSTGITAIDGEKAEKVDLKNFKTVAIKNWLRFGHGRAYKGFTDAAGIRLKEVLGKYFPGATSDDWFLFCACDGYRVLISGYEIFKTDDGDLMYLMTRMKGKKVPGNYMLAPVADWFVDRDVWGLSHIVRVKAK